MLLFLGAGASRAFSMPTMMDLTKYVLDDLKQRNKKTYIIDYIVNRVIEMGFKPDIESILTCVDALKNPEEGIKQAGPYGGLISVRRKPDERIIGQKEELDELSKDIRIIIRKYCGFPEEGYEKTLIQIYDVLFEKFSITERTGLDVYTTNYDLCFEKYCNIKNIPYNDLSHNRKLDYRRINQKRNWNIYKLHGSSNWMLDEKNEIKILDRIPQYGENSLSGKMKGEVMIYPTTEKYLSRNPYFSLLTSLRNDLMKKGSDKESNLIVIIGYSFRDMAINNAFIDALQSQDFKNKQKYLIDPEVNTILKYNIPELNKFIETRKDLFDNVNNLDFGKKN